MKNMFKRSLAAVMAIASLTVGMVGMSANAIIINNPNEFILNYATGAPGSEIQTSLTNVAYVISDITYLTIRVDYCKKSTNTKKCRFNVPLRAKGEPEWKYCNDEGFYAVYLKTHGEEISFSCELVREDSTQGYGNVTYSGRVYPM